MEMPIDGQQILPLEIWEKIALSASSEVMLNLLLVNRMFRELLLRVPPTKMVALAFEKELALVKNLQITERQKWRENILKHDYSSLIFEEVFQVRCSGNDFALFHYWEICPHEVLLDSIVFCIKNQRTRCLNKLVRMFVPCFSCFSENMRVIHDHVFRPGSLSEETEQALREKLRCYRRLIGV